MRYFPQNITFPLLAVLILLSWMKASTQVQVGGTTNVASAQEAIDEIPAQGLPAPGGPAQAETPESTRAPRPTPTPMAVPPPSNPNTIQLLVIFGVLVVLVVIFGLLLNRNRVF